MTDRLYLIKLIVQYNEFKIMHNSLYPQENHNDCHKRIDFVLSGLHQKLKELEGEN